MYLPVGTLLQGGRYEIIRYISSGGFGCTYEARDTKFKSKIKSVAIKEFFVKDFCCRDAEIDNSVTATRSKGGLVDKLRANFLDEANVLFEFEHPNIVRVTDVFEENGTAYYVMDYITGCTLSEIIESKGPLREDEALGYIRQVADALKYVHANNRAHLDVKPQNIMVYDDGRAVLIDFGVSKQYDEVNGENTSALVGFTPGYAPIEQSGNARVKLDAATDIYALGATLYKLLTGTTPVAATMRAGDNAFKELPFLPTVSSAMRNAIDKAMQISRNDRPQNIDEFLCLLESKTGVANVKNKKILPIILLLLISFIAAGCFILFSGGFFSVTSENGDASNNIITANDANSKYSDGDLIPILDESGKFGFVDKEGNDIIPCRYDDVDRFLNGLAKVRIGDKNSGKWGLIDKSGKEVVPCKYDYVSINSNGLAVVRIGDKDSGKWGVMDKTGKEVVPCKYDWVADFHEGLALVRVGYKKTRKYGYIDRLGKEVIPCTYKHACSFSEGMAEVTINGKKGFIDKVGNIIVPCKYDWATDFREGRAMVGIDLDWQEYRYGFVDKAGEEVTSCVYEDLDNFREGLAGFMLNGKYGFMDKNCKVVIPPIYEDVFGFNGGLAPVKRNGKWGMIDKDGNVVVVFAYNEIIPAHIDGLYAVCKKGRYGCVDVAGNEIIPCRYENCVFYRDGIAKVQMNGKYGYIDKNENVVIQFIYDDASSFSDGLARVKKDGKEYYIGKDGKEYIKKSMYK